MRRIEGEVFTYAKHPRTELVLRDGATWSSFGLDGAARGTVEKEGPTWAAVSRIRLWDGYPVRSYKQLVQTVSHIASGNRLQLLYFRGQLKDYRDPNGRTALYPSICRPKKVRLQSARLKARDELLSRAIQEIRKNALRLDLTHHIHRLPEASMALLQHYELCRTPLLDVTRSLRVAASFALLDGAPEGFVYVIGMPYPYGSISHQVDYEARIVDLQSVCPYKALRPHFQEGVLIGRFPWLGAKEPGDNAAYRLIAKLRLINHARRFWKSGFTGLARNVLLPTRDPYGQLLREVLAPVLGGQDEHDD
jgi:hypothetical protein